MKKHIKPIAAILLVVMLISCLSVGLTACINLNGFYSKKLNMLADSLALSLLGDDAYAWNVFSINPSESYGYERGSTPSWYSYNEMTEDDVDGLCQVLNLFYRELKTIPLAKLDKVDAITYRSLENTLITYINNYGSDYALDFALIGGSYINSEGGYVADFASLVENFAFRNEGDVSDLLAITQSTKEAFESYLDYAGDRVDAGYPLYDYSIVSMQEYLDEVLEKGDTYYLYDFVDRKIDAADFLTDSKKSAYKADFEEALTESFMDGVQILSNGLNEYKGHVQTTEMTYLAAYGTVGTEYYKWCFEQKTGLKNVNIYNILNELKLAYNSLNGEIDAIEAEIESYKETNSEIYDEFYAYVNGEKALLDLTTPQEILAYLKEAAEYIVPELQTEPDISFKYMDVTVADRTSAVAYYLKSPLDQNDAPEYITLNPKYATSGGTQSLLTTIAHEGYPGHLYAHVKAKESGLSLMTNTMSTTAYAEGWAVYTEIALLEHIASTTDNIAIKAYCKYAYLDELAGFISPVLLDIQMNYMAGYTLQDFVNAGWEADRIRGIMETLMEDPTLYVSYGFGGYMMYKSHMQARTALGNAYNEVEFNGLLLSEGMGPTLERLKGITQEYIASKK